MIVRVCLLLLSYLFEYCTEGFFDVHCAACYTWRKYRRARWCQRSQISAMYRPFGSGEIVAKIMTLVFSTVYDQREHPAVRAQYS